MTEKEQLLKITPSSELKFKLGDKPKQIPTLMQLHNPGSEIVAFKVKTTSPKRYVVRPNTGAVAPGASVEIVVIMQHGKDMQDNLKQCKDKFLVQSIVTPKADLESKDFASLFSKENEPLTCQQKLKVSYVEPVPPPSPVPENQEAEAAATAESEAKRGVTGGDITAKYADAMSSLAQATSERNAATASKEQVQKDLASMSAKVDSLTAQLASASSAGAATTTTVTKAQVGFTLLHLLLTAILAFLVGRYT